MKPILICLFLATLILSSCTYSYVPNLTNAPLLKEKKDHAVSIYTSEPSGLNIQGGVAITNYLGLIGNASSTIFSRKGKYRFAELGLGFYKVSFNKFHAEFFSGIGYGSGEDGSMGLRNKTIVEQGSYRRFFFQPTIGYRSKKFEFALLCRFSNVQYTSFSQSNQSNSDLPWAQLYEPAGIIRFGFGDGFFKTNRIVIQTGFSSAMKHHDSFDDFPLSMAGIGITFRGRD